MKKYFPAVFNMKGSIYAGANVGKVLRKY